MNESCTEMLEVCLKTK